MRIKFKGKKAIDALRVPIIMEYHDDPLFIVVKTGGGENPLLFSGVCISPGESGNTVGDVSNKWTRSSFKVFEGSLILSN